MSDGLDDFAVENRRRLNIRQNIFTDLDLAGLQAQDFGDQKINIQNLGEVKIEGERAENAEKQVADGEDATQTLKIDPYEGNLTVKGELNENEQSGYQTNENITHVFSPDRELYASVNRKTEDINIIDDSVPEASFLEANIEKINQWFYYVDGGTDSLYVYNTDDNSREFLLSDVYGLSFDQKREYFIVTSSNSYQRYEIIDYNNLNKIDETNINPQGTGQPVFYHKEKDTYLVYDRANVKFKEIEADTFNLVKERNEGRMVKSYIDDNSNIIIVNRQTEWKIYNYNDFSEQTVLQPASDDANNFQVIESKNLINFVGDDNIYLYDFDGNQIDTLNRKNDVGYERILGPVTDADDYLVTFFRADSNGNQVEDCVIYDVDSNNGYTELKRFSVSEIYAQDNSNFTLGSLINDTRTWKININPLQGETCKIKGGLYDEEKTETFDENSEAVFNNITAGQWAIEALSNTKGVVIQDGELDKTKTIEQKPSE